MKSWFALFSLTLLDFITIGYSGSGSHSSAPLIDNELFQQKKHSAAAMCNEKMLKLRNDSKENPKKWLHFHRFGKSARKWNWKGSSFVAVVRPLFGAQTTAIAPWMRQKIVSPLHIYYLRLFHATTWSSESIFTVCWCHSHALNASSFVYSQINDILRRKSSGECVITTGKLRFHSSSSDIVLEQCDTQSAKPLNYTRTNLLHSKR